MEAPEVGSVICFDYPTHNRLDLPDEWLTRVVLVCRVEDRRRVPLDVKDFLRRPMLRRGAILIGGLDLDLSPQFRRRQPGQERQFYVDAAWGERLPGYQLGVYNPDELDDSPELIGRIYWPTPSDRLLMQDAICRLQRKMRGKMRGLKLGAFPVEG